MENDLEPMNVELLQELLGVVDPNKNELETFLNKPFNTDVEVSGVDVPWLKGDSGFFNVDLDRTVEIFENPSIVNDRNIEIKRNPDENKVLIEYLIHFIFDMIYKRF